MNARLMGLLGRRAGLRVFRLLLRRLEPAPPPESGLRSRLLAPAEVAALSADADLDLAPDRTAAAAARGDLCVGAFDGGVLAGYCWLAFAPLPHLDGVWAAFDPAAVWTYKSFVRPAYRGRGLAGTLYRRADDECLARGRRWSVLCIESHNRPSLRAGYRAGYGKGAWAAYLRRGPTLRAGCWPGAGPSAARFYLP